MKKSRFTEEQIIGILKEAEAGQQVHETCRKPKCGEPNYKEVSSKEVILIDPDTPCECVRKDINRNYNKPLPGL